MFETVENTPDGYTLMGTTRVGRPVTININYDGRPKFNIDVQTFEGTDGTLSSETELHHMMAEIDALSARLTTICDAHWSDNTEVLLSKVASLMEVGEVEPDHIMDMLESQRSVGMGM